MKATVISTDKAPRPGGWYSQAYRFGTLVFTAGVTANDPVTQKLTAPGDMERQTRQAIENLEQVLLEAGSDLEHVIKTLVFVADIDQFECFNRVYKEYFPKDPPARSTMQVGKFNHGMMVEIEAVATVRDLME